MLLFAVEADEPPLLPPPPRHPATSATTAPRPKAQRFEPNTRMAPSCFERGHPRPTEDRTTVAVERHLVRSRLRGERAPKWGALVGVNAEHAVSALSRPAWTPLVVVIVAARERRVTDSSHTLFVSDPART